MTWASVTSHVASRIESQSSLPASGPFAASFDKTGKNYSINAPGIRPSQPWRNLDDLRFVIAPHGPPAVLRDIESGADARISANGELNRRAGVFRGGDLEGQLLLGQYSYQRKLAPRIEVGDSSAHARRKGHAREGQGHRDLRKIVHAQVRIVDHLDLADGIPAFADGEPEVIASSASQRAKRILHRDFFRRAFPFPVACGGGVTASDGQGQEQQRHDNPRESAVK